MDQVIEFQSRLLLFFCLRITTNRNGNDTDSVSQQFHKIYNIYLLPIPITRPPRSAQLTPTNHPCNIGQKFSSFLTTHKSIPCIIREIKSAENCYVNMNSTNKTEDYFIYYKMIEGIFYNFIAIRYDKANIVK